ncbi:MULTISPECIES: DUF523 domain-containing protein [unclassified Cocleimonas]|uniref:DUF523 domain-containing protein n=1 Tax=unclassified Cocleimonas TaxID=2639732 RepID=UPI002DD68706|nr:MULTISPECIES: DUF523 domain-containing protein [unclassified Cocleimonas]
MIQGKILISACLIGNPVRYNGSDLLLDHPLMTKWRDEERLVPICPEVAGGLPVPRLPAEIQFGDAEKVLDGKAQVLQIDQADVTKAFIDGANKALELALATHCKVAILTERSPSCGSSMIFDGTFTNEKILGIGVTTALLERNNIRVFNQNQLDELDYYLQNN